MDKCLVIIACHTNDELKEKVLVYNLKYFSELSNTIVIVNSYKYNDDSFECRINNLGLESFIVFDYVQNDKFLYYSKWVNYLQKIDYTKYNNITLTNDSYLITRSLEDYKNLIDPSINLVALLDSYQIKYHYPDFLRTYNKQGIKYILDFYNSRINSDSELVNFPIDSSKIFSSSVKILYKTNSDISEDIHLIDDHLEKYLNKFNYPIIKLKKIRDKKYYFNFPTDFDSNDYKSTNPDLNHLDLKGLFEHFIYYGPSEGRFYKKKQIKQSYNFPTDFDPNEYKLIHPDLSHLDSNGLFEHFIYYGIKEGRRYKKNQIKKLPEYLQHYLDNLEIDFLHYSKTIFILSHCTSNTGAPIVARNLQKYLEKNKFNTILLYMKDFHDKDIINYINDVSYHSNTSPVIICNTVCTYDFIKKFYDAFFIVYLYPHEYINDFHNNVDFIVRMIYKNPIPTFFPSQKLYDNYISNGNIIQNPIIMNGYGYNLETLEYNKNEPILFKKNESNFLITMIGTIDHRKNQQAFIDYVYYKIKQKFNHVKLLLIGKEIDKLNLNNLYSDSIIIIGDVMNAIPYINLSDVVVSYSLNEVLPLNILESMYCCKAIIATDVGCVSDAIINYETGFLIKVNEHEICFNILSDLITNEQLRFQIGNNAYKFFVSTYDEDICLKKIKDELIKL
jgi:glycosyltransferase involved in cell wall biosynthesis